MITKRNIARGMMATGSLVYLLGIWRTCPLFSGKGYFLGVLVMGMFAGSRPSARQSVAGTGRRFYCLMPAGAAAIGRPAAGRRLVCTGRLA